MDVADEAILAPSACVRALLQKDDAAIVEIKALEHRRYRAMLAGDTAVLDELCSVDLIYTHSKADDDDKRSYLPDRCYLFSLFVSRFRSLCYAPLSAGLESCAKFSASMKLPPSRRHPLIKQLAWSISRPSWPTLRASGSAPTGPCAPSVKLPRRGAWVPHSRYPDYPPY
jgi:hypothetical protein